MYNKNKSKNKKRKMAILENSDLQKSQISEVINEKKLL